jgi:hypothetical protein
MGEVPGQKNYTFSTYCCEHVWVLKNLVIERIFGERMAGTEFFSFLN